MDFQLTLSYEEYSVYPSISSIFCSLLEVYYPSQSVSLRMTEVGSGKNQRSAQALALPKTDTLQVT